MKALVYFLACIGACVMALALAGSVGIGYFRLAYSLSPVECFGMEHGA